MRHPSLNTNTLPNLTLDEHVKELVVGFGGVCAGHDLAEDHLSAASAAVFRYGAQTGQTVSCSCPLLVQPPALSTRQQSEKRLLTWSCSRL